MHDSDNEVAPALFPLKELAGGLAFRLAVS
jgi:hypothetical protein